ncbi:MAG: RNA chaperone ProQ [Psychrosphaera sp.]|nr:RNA chaperone ProQ [Psychrosphaera sp.]
MDTSEKTSEILNEAPVATPVVTPVEAPVETPVETSAETPTEVAAPGVADEVEKLTDVKKIIAFLAGKFPLCFTVEGEAKPLKIGIFKELAEQMGDEGIVSRTQLRQALRRYTSSWRYLKCVAKGGVRIDLDGEPGDALETDHIEHAVKELEQSKAKFEKSRKAMKDKKIYKKSQKETGENTRKQAKFNSSKQRSDQGGKKSDSKVDKKADNKVKNKVVELLPLTPDNNKTGTAVLVKFGQSPVPGVIKEVSSKGEIHVQLNSGMVIKTKFENIFLA